MKKLAIIGSSVGQIQLCQKARLMSDVKTYGIAWDKDAICKELVDQFVPISIMEKEAIVDFCRNEGIDGIVSNASELTAIVVAYVAEKLGLPCTPYQLILNIQNKDYVRNQTKSVEGLNQIQYKVLSFDELNNIDQFPCVIKPTRGSAKKGVNFICRKADLDTLMIPNELKALPFLCEEYIDGREVSVEVLSYKGKHLVVTITDKKTSGPPHFVELSHTQPTTLSKEIESHIRNVVPKILTAVGFQNGASHIELKVTNDGRLYLIEINPRGGGDMISNRLVEMSTDFDYVKEMINVALDRFVDKPIHNVGFSGIYFICSQNSHILDFYNKHHNDSCVMDSEFDGAELRNATTNYDRNGYVIVNKLIV